MPSAYRAGLRFCEICVAGSAYRTIFGDPAKIYNRSLASNAWIILDQADLACRVGFRLVVNILLLTALCTFKKLKVITETISAVYISAVTVLPLSAFLIAYGAVHKNFLIDAICLSISSAVLGSFCMDGLSFDTFFFLSLAGGRMDKSVCILDESGKLRS